LSCAGLRDDSILAVAGSDFIVQVRGLSVSLSVFIVVFETHNVCVGFVGLHACPSGSVWPRVMVLIIVFASINVCSDAIVSAFAI
jgi:hypothetical protein